MKDIGHTMIRWITRYRLPILSGFLIGTSYIPFPEWTLFLCLVPLWIFCLENPQPKRVFIAGWLSQFFLTLIGFHWIAHTAHAFGHMPWALSILILLLFCAFAHLHIPLAMGIWALLNRWYPLTKVSSLLVFIALLSLGERFYPAIFPWNFGNPWLWNQMGGYHWADVIGFEGLSSVTFTVNAMVAMAWFARRHLREAILWLAGAIVLVTTLNWTGPLHGKTWTQTDRAFKIIAVQPNIGNLEKEYAQHGRGYQSYILERQIRLSEAALVKDPDSRLVIWPETAYPDVLEESTRNPLLATRLFSYIRNSNVGLLTGSFSQDPKDRREYNGMFLFNKGAQLTGEPYRKSILLAFGEYFPLGDSFPILYSLFPVVSNFSRGVGPTTMEYEDVQFGPQICYEGLYPEFAAQQTAQGADILMNLTNDSWFGTTFEPLQHLFITLGRGVENRRPLLRVTNTGISTLMLASGDIVEMSPLHTEWTRAFSIPYRDKAPLTFFTRYQKWIPLFWLVFLAMVLIWNRYAKSRHARLD